MNRRLVLRDEARLEGPLPIPRDLDRQWAVVGQDRLAAGAVAMIGGVLGLGATGRVSKVMGELAA